MGSVAYSLVGTGIGIGSGALPYAMNKRATLQVNNGPCHDPSTSLNLTQCPVVGASRMG